MDPGLKVFYVQQLPGAIQTHLFGPDRTGRLHSRSIVSNMNLLGSKRLRNVRALKTNKHTHKKHSLLRRIVVEEVEERGNGGSHRPMGMTLCFILLIMVNY